MYSVKKLSFSRPVSLFKPVFFSPIIILFLQYSRKRSSHVPEIWPIQGLMFNIVFQTPNSNKNFLRSLCSTFVLWKGEICGSGERNIKILIDFRKSPRFSLTSPLSQLNNWERSQVALFYYVWWSLLLHIFFYN